jgi:polysaccharide biosynthesis transport protein
MDLVELLRILWRRKIAFALSVAVVIGIAVAYLSLETPVYESESTLALSPEEADELAFFSTIDVIMPTYADAATSQPILRMVQDRVWGSLGGVSVETFPETAIFEILVRHPDPRQAREVAQTITDVLISQAAGDRLGPEFLSLEQIDVPLVSEEPVYPRIDLTLAVAALLGVGLGVAVSLMREHFASRLGTTESIGRVADLPVHGEIPRAAALSRVKAPEDLSRNPELRAVAEAFRDIRTNLLFGEERFRSLLVTSPEGSHGKTTVAFGLAVTLARLGARTLLVDGDLRRGRISEMLGLPHTPGLMEVLTGGPLEQGIRSTSLRTLDVLPSGTRTENPESFIDIAFRGVIAKLQDHYDKVIIDSTPLAPINDARVMASFTDRTLLVTSPDETTPRQLQIAVERLAIIGERPTAIVVNKSARRRATDYYTSLPREGDGSRAWGLRRARGRIRRQ